MQKYSPPHKPIDAMSHLNLFICQHFPPHGTVASNRTNNRTCRSSARSRSNATSNTEIHPLQNPTCLPTPAASNVFSVPDTFLCSSTEKVQCPFSKCPPSFFPPFLPPPPFSSSFFFLLFLPPSSISLDRVGLVKSLSGILLFPFCNARLQPHNFAPQFGNDCGKLRITRLLFCSVHELRCIKPLIFQKPQFCRRNGRLQFRQRPAVLRKFKTYRKAGFAVAIVQTLTIEYFKIVQPI